MVTGCLKFIRILVQQHSITEPFSEEITYHNTPKKLCTSPNNFRDGAVLKT